MADNPASHFGRQLRKERLAQGWSLDELARNTGINAARLSRIENGDNGGNCVETASGDGVILVRDTTDRDGATLAFGARAWREFTHGLR